MGEVCPLNLAQNANLAIVAAAEPAALRAHGRARGWRSLRLLSAADSTFKYDFRSEDAEGRQDSAISVFTQDAVGRLRHVYTTHPWLDDDVNERGIDPLQPATSCSISRRRDAGAGMHRSTTAQT